MRVARGRTRHGFALNIDPDLSMFDHIVPCGITDSGVTSMAALLGTEPDLREVVDRVVAQFAPSSATPTSSAKTSRGRPADDLAPVPDAGPGPASPSAGAPRRRPGCSSPPDADRPAPPAWMRVRADLGPGYRSTEAAHARPSTSTPCARRRAAPTSTSAGRDRTATFMILGDRCTRACGFCLVDTRSPGPLDPDEPDRVAEAVAALDLEHAVVTSVARDDLPDGGAVGVRGHHPARCGPARRAPRSRC